MSPAWRDDTPIGPMPWWLRIVLAVVAIAAFLLINGALDHDRTFQTGPTTTTEAP